MFLRRSRELNIYKVCKPLLFALSRNFPAQTMLALKAYNKKYIRWGAGAGVMMMRVNSIEGVEGVCICTKGQDALTYRVEIILILDAQT